MNTTNTRASPITRALGYAGALLVASVAAIILAAPVILAAGTLAEVSSDNTSTGGTRMVRYRETDITSVSADTNILPSAITPQFSASSLYIDIQLATSRAVKLVAIRSNNTSKSMLLNDSVALTAGAHKTLGPIAVAKGITYQLQLSGGSSAIDYLIITEVSGSAVGRAGGGSSSGGGGSATLNGITNPGAGELLWSVAGSGNSQITGPSDDGFVVTAGSARSLNLYADNGNGSSIQVASDGHIELNAAGSNQDIQLTPSGSGAVVANPIASGAGDDLDLRAPSGDINLRPNSDASGVGGTVQVRAPVLAINDAAGEVQFGFPVDVGLKRSAAGIVKVTNGAAGNGALLNQQLSVRVYKGATQTITNNTRATVTFPSGATADWNNGSWWSAASDGATGARLTLPNTAPVGSKVRLSYTFEVTTTGAGIYSVGMEHYNSSDVLQSARYSEHASTTQTTFFEGGAKFKTVGAGDYFKVTIFQNTGADRALAGDLNTSFEATVEGL